MDISIRELHSDKDIQDCIELQGEIWGLTEAGKMSPVTLKALAMEYPPIGILLGAFSNEKIIAFQIIFPTLEHGTVYGHMLGILKDYRDMNIGYLMQKNLFELLRKKKVKRIVWTYEPLEGRNANNYIVKSGGTVIRYLQEHYAGDVDIMSGGMPMDRFLMAVDLNCQRVMDALEGNFHRERLDEDLASIPVATVDSMPDVPEVLVRIPGDLQKMKKENLAEALAYRYDTRHIFTEYINRRGYVSERFLTGDVEGERRNYYILTKS
jgi:chorismate synthase